MPISQWWISVGNPLRRESDNGLIFYMQGLCVAPIIGGFETNCYNRQDEARNERNKFNYQTLLRRQKYKLLSASRASQLHVHLLSQERVLK